MSGHHHHHHGENTAEENIRWVFFLNLSFALIEIVGGLWTNSMAILADALHDFGDSFALGLSWYFARLSTKSRDRYFSYGYRRFSLVSAFLTGTILLIGSIIIMIETVPRLLTPQDVHVEGMLLLAILGTVVNGIAVWRLSGGQTQNEKVVRLHLLEDVLGWVAVLLASVVLLFIYIPILDPLLSLGIAFYVFWQAAKNLRGTLYIFLQAIPIDFDLKNLEKQLLEQLPLNSIHDIHLWSLDGDYHVLSLHVVMKEEMSRQRLVEIKQQIRDILTLAHIEHVTIEVEFPGETCAYEHQHD